jgi:hypothetical protein
LKKAQRRLVAEPSVHVLNHEDEIGEVRMRKGLLVCSEGWPVQPCKNIFQVSPSPKEMRALKK